jgi:hypothetical protein
MKSSKYAPCILAIEFYLILTGISIWYSMSRTGGHFIYPLDDAYISMAMSKNLAQHGVMGLTRHEFSFSSSCPLWIWLIALGNLLTGTAWWVALLLGLLGGVGVILAAHRILQTSGIGNRAAIFGLLSLIVLTPLPALAVSGMEHVLHIALVLWFVARACAWLTGQPSLAPFLKILALVPLMVLTRYESLFLAGIFALLLLARKKWVHAGSILAAALAPVVLLGMVSVSKGWQWLPNSLLLKGNIPDLSSFRGILNLLGLRSVGLLFGTPHLVALVAALLAISIWRSARGEGIWTRGQLWIVFALGGTLIHLQFASVGWFYRYEAYLVALGVIALLVNRIDELVRFRPRRHPVAAQNRLPNRSAAVLAAAIIAIPLFSRGAEALWGFPEAAHNVFEQQYQMALFFRTYYPGASIALNDVGAVNYFADIRCLDLVGLCDRRILRLKKHRAYDTPEMARCAAAAQVQVAAVYDTWFTGSFGPLIPAAWRRVGSWHIADNSFLGGDTVTFYAVQPQEAEKLERSLREFASRLPAGVAQKL